MDSLHIVFAGTRATDELKKQIEEKGGHVHIGLTKKTTHLVVKETARGSKKIEEAREKGIAVISLEDFLATHSLTFEVPKRGHNTEHAEQTNVPKSPKKAPNGEAKPEEPTTPKKSAKSAEAKKAKAEAEKAEKAEKAANAAEVERLKQAIESQDTLVQCLTKELEQKVAELETMREKLNEKMSAMS
jgi:anti-sigma28 factor (negative regulator of flagellin synthesis)